jgi:hypothetical protein
MTAEPETPLTPTREQLRTAKYQAWVEGTKARRDYRGDLIELNPYGRGGSK